MTFDELVNDIVLGSKIFAFSAATWLFLRLVAVICVYVITYKECKQRRVQKKEYEVLKEISQQQAAILEELKKLNGTSDDKAKIAVDVNEEGKNDNDKPETDE